MAGNVLYIDYFEWEAKQKRKLAGAERFASAHGWKIKVVPRDSFSLPELPELLARHRPIGCIVTGPQGCDDLPPRLFNPVPVVYLDPPDRPNWRGSASVVCDNAAVAAEAFRELSAGFPPSYAAVSYRIPQKWARRRIAAFQSLCAKAGKDCHVLPENPGESETARTDRLAAWAVTLPPNCAIFAVNDFTAREIAYVLVASGRRIPRDATVIGVDGADEPAKEDPHPPISSIKFDLERVGYVAAKMLAGLLAAKNAKESSASFAAGKRNETFGPLFTIRRESTRGRGRREPHILEAVDIIRREACDGLTAAALAARFRCSRNHFEFRFREAMGHSVLNEILHVRMEKVQALLSRPDMKIDAIADFCGFRTERELRKLFKLRTGMSMRQWREKNCR